MKNINKFLTAKPIAHRGLWGGEIPENSLKAFENAVKNGVPIECDLQLIEGGTIIIFHDKNTKRMTGINKETCRLKKEDLKTFKLNGTNETIPTLQQFLKIVNGKVPVLFEIKNFERKNRGCETEFLKQIENYSGEFAVCSFNPLVVKFFKLNAPHIARGQLASYFKGEKIAFYIKFLLKRMYFNKKSRPDFVIYDCKNVPNRFLKKVKDLPILTYPIATFEEMKRVKKYCNNIIFEHINIEKLGYLQQTGVK